MNDSTSPPIPPDPIVINYTAVALIGLLAGFLLGIAFATRDNRKSDLPPTAHPRSLAPTAA